MIKIIARLCLLSAASLFVSVATAGITDELVATRRGNDSSIKPGRWHLNFNKAKQYAEDNGMPFIAVWSNGDNCGHCVKFENNAMSSAFIEWQRNSGIVYYFGYFADPYPENTLGPSCVWASGGNTGKTLPFVRIYWKKKGATSATVDIATDGDTWDGNKGRSTVNNNTDRPAEYVYAGDYGTYNPGGRYMINYLTNGVNGVLRKYKYNPTPAVTYFGGEMNYMDPQLAPNACLQAEYVNGTLMTTNIAVTLTRTNTTAIANVATNCLIVTHPSGKVKDYEVIWAKNETNKTVNVKFAQGWDVPSNGVDTVQLLLTTPQASGATTNFIGHATNYVAIVKDVPNSPKNPLWLGERASADDLEFGEWTMDLDLVKAKVKAYNKGRAVDRAYTMVLVGGSCWCPDCASSDKYFYGTEAFRDWAVKNNVALGVVEIPDLSSTSTTATLLTESVVAVSDRYVTFNNSTAKDESERYQSGIPYLSRKMISASEAAKVAARNKQLAGKDTLNGGFRRPDSANKYRPGVPTLFLLNDDDTVAARWGLFSDSGPTSSNENYLKRMDEMLAMVGTSEEANDTWQTTGESVAKRGSLKDRTLSHMDLRDVYRISAEAYNKETSFKVDGEGSADLIVQILQVGSDAAEKVIAESSGVLADGLDVTAVIPGTNCYLVIKAATVPNKASTPVSAVLSATSAGSTVLRYAITSDTVLPALEAVLTETIGPDDPLYADHTVTLKTEAGQSYRITNLDTDAIEGLFEPGETADVYTALETGSTSVTLKDKDPETGIYSMEYQLWNTGKIGFVRASASVGEPESLYGILSYVDYSLSIARAGGTSGSASARIFLDYDQSSALTNDVYYWQYDGKVLEWAEGDDSVTNLSVRIWANEFADGNQTLVFKLERVGGDAGLDIDTFTLTVKDNDEPVAGTLAIRSTEPAMAKDMTVFAAPGQKLTLCIDRFDGSYGSVTGSLSTTVGTLSEKTLVWAGRDTSVKTVTLTMPEDGARSGQVVLTSQGGAVVDPTQKYLTVKALRSSACFLQNTRSIDAVRYLPIALNEVLVDMGSLAKDDAELQVVKYSGTLAPGLTAKYDEVAHKLVLSGTPSKVGAWTAVYQIIEDGVSGQVVALTVTVSDPTSPDKGSSAVANPGLAETRTFANILVFDTTEGALAGTLTVSVPPSGRMSAKFKAADGTVTTYLSEGWDAAESDASKGAFGAALQVVAGNSETTLTVVAKPEAVEASFGNSQTGHDYQCVMPYSWTSGASAVDWKGYYTVSLPQTNVLSSLQYTTGAGFVTLRMNDDASITSGKMSYAGVLPNGKAFSGTSVLVPSDWNEELKIWAHALLPVQSTSSTDVLGGVLAIKPNAASTYVNERRSVFAYDYGRLLWNYDPRGLLGSSSESEETSKTELDAFGGYYEPTEDFASCCNVTFYSTVLTFFAQTELLPLDEAFGYGTPSAWETNATTITVYTNSTGTTKIKLVDSVTAAKANGLSLSFSRDIGTVSGQLTVAFEDGSKASATYKGVVMPGWGSADCTSCTLGNADAIKRPFISGTAWFSDVYNYVDTKGRQRKLSVKRGLPISVGTEAGK